MFELRRIPFPSIKDKTTQGVMRVVESDQMPFPIGRVFTISADAGSQRGKHAHKQCNQLLVCISGSLELLCDDGEQREVLRLTPDDDGVLVQNGIWAEQTYLDDRTVLLVMCDQPYDENDYIRDHIEFINWKKKS